jgi:CHAT domain
MRPMSLLPTTTQARQGYRNLVTAVANRVRHLRHVPEAAALPEPVPGDPPDPLAIAPPASPTCSVTSFLSAVTHGSPRMIPPSTCPLSPSTGRHVILFLAANPSETTRLALDEECAAIERELRMTTCRDDFDFRSKWAVSVDEMMRYLNELQPAIIHFSGHGGGSTGIYLEEGRLEAPAAPRDVGGTSSAGIYLQDEHHQQQYVRAHALAQMIGSAAPAARLVVLNACFSDAAAEALRGVVDCVVGMRGAIGDDAARSFAVGFYRALGHRRSVGNAVDQAVATLAAKRLPGEHLPVCRTRDGVSAYQVTLSQLAPPPPRGGR